MLHARIIYDENLLKRSAQRRHRFTVLVFYGTDAPMTSEADVTPANRQHLSGRRRLVHRQQFRQNFVPVETLSAVLLFVDIYTTSGDPVNRLLADFVLTDLGRI